MALVTFQILDGLEMGQVLSDLPTPVSIGREEENDIRLNDERVSRFHAKIQEDEGRIILSDLESTNGTRVNGHPVKMRILRIGDQIMIGRCLMVYGSRQELATRSGLTSTREKNSPGATLVPGDSSDHGQSSPASSFAAESRTSLQENPFPEGAPDLPHNLSPLHAAQLSDVLSYVRSRLLHVLQVAEEQHFNSARQNGKFMAVPSMTWHQLQQLSMDLTIYLQEIAEP